MHVQEWEVLRERSSCLSLSERQQEETRLLDTWNGYLWQIQGERGRPWQGALIEVNTHNVSGIVFFVIEVHVSSCTHEIRAPYELFCPIEKSNV